MPDIIERKKQFGERLKKLRKQSINPDTKKKYTQAEIGEYIGIRAQSYSAYEKGETFPDVEKLFLIGDLLHCDVAYLIGDIDMKTHDAEYIRYRFLEQAQAVKSVSPS